MATQTSRNQESNTGHDGAGYTRQNSNVESRGVDARTSNERERGLQQSRETGRRGNVARQSQLWRNTTGANVSYSLMRRITDELDRIFQDFGLGVEQQAFSPFNVLSSGLTSDLLAHPVTATQTTWSPRVDVLSRGNQLVFRADLPGLTKDDVTVEIGDGILTIHGECEEGTEGANEGYYYKERNFGTFYRSLPIPDGVNPDQIQASFRNGILEISMANPAASGQQRRKIAIQA